MLCVFVRARAVCVLACVCVRAWLSTLRFGSQIIDAVTALATITSLFVSSADVVFSWEHRNSHGTASFVRGCSDGK